MWFEMRHHHPLAFIIPPSVEFVVMCSAINSDIQIYIYIYIHIYTYVYGTIIYIYTYVYTHRAELQRVLRNVLLIISLLAETAWVLCPKTSHSGPRTLGSASLRRITGGNSIELRRLARCSERRVHSSLQQINGRHPGRSCKQRKREVNGSKPFFT